MTQHKKRIIMLNIDADLYGANKVFYQVAAALQNDGHDVLIFLPKKGPLTDLFEKNSLNFKILNLAVVRRKYFHPLGMLNRLFKFLHAYRTLKKEAKHWQADTIYSNTILIWVGMIVSRQLRLRHFWHIHEILETGLPKRIFGYLLSKNKGDYIYVSKAVENCWNQFFIDKSKCHLLYNGVEKPIADKPGILKKELGLGSDTVLIGLIGRINHWKGQEYFIEIAAEISERHQNIVFVIVGDPYPGNEHLVDKLKNKITDLGLSNVFMPGFRADVGNVLHSLDIFMSASVKDDPFPLVILEAMSCGLPIVATKQGGAIEMLEEGKSGLFVPINDAGKAAEIMSELIVSENKRIMMGRNALNRVNQYFSEDTFNQNVRNIFK